MFSAVSIFPIIIALLLIEAVLIIVVFRNQNDRSAQLWASGSLTLVAGLSLLVIFDQTQPFIRYFLANFFASYSTILYLNSLQAAFGITQRKKILSISVCLLLAAAVYLLVKLNLLLYVAALAGLSFGAIHTYAYVQIQKIKPRASNYYLNVIALTFLVGGLVWFIRIPLSMGYGLRFAGDEGNINYVLMFLNFIFLMVRQVSYLVMRINTMLTERIDRASEFANATQRQMLKSLTALSLTRDNETGNHILRTQWYVKEVALKLMATGHYKDELSKELIEIMFMVAPLHDIGKVGMPDSVLLKPDSLSATEWAVMKTHTTIGESILKAAIEGDAKHAHLLKMAIEIAGGHHERWNGKGYPRGLSAQQIPLSARIMSVADVYDALVSARVYKRKWSHEQAIEEIKCNSGEYFDPLVVEAFLSIQDKVKNIAAAHADAQ